MEHWPLMKYFPSFRQNSVLSTTVKCFIEIYHVSRLQHISVYHWINEGKQSFNLDQICFIKDFFACKSAQAISYSSARITVFSMPCSHCKPSSHTGCSAGLLRAVWLLLFQCNMVRDTTQGYGAGTSLQLISATQCRNRRSKNRLCCSAVFEEEFWGKMPLNVLAVVPGA